MNLLGRMCGVAWDRYPVDLAMTLLMTMVCVPGILMVMYVVIAWCLPQITLGSALVAIMLLGATGMMGVYLALSWTHLIRIVSREMHVQGE